MGATKDRRDLLRRFLHTRRDEVAASHCRGCSLLAASAAGHAQTIADLPDDKFKLVVDKTQVYTNALRASRAVQKSFERYASWVDLKTGPTGKEKSIDSGLPDISSALPEITDAGKKGPGMWPPLPGADGMVKKWPTRPPLSRPW